MKSLTVEELIEQLQRVPPEWRGARVVAFDVDEYCIQVVGGELCKEMQLFEIKVTPRVEIT